MKGFGKLLFGLVCCGHVVVLAMSCMWWGGDPRTWCYVALAVGLSQVGLTAVFAGLGSSPLAVRVPGWGIVCAVPLIVVWVSALHAEPDGDMLGLLVVVAVSWGLVVFFLTAIRLLPFLSWRLAYVDRAHVARQPARQQYSLLELFILMAATGIILSLIHELLQMSPSRTALLDEAFHACSPGEFATVVSILAAVHLVVGPLFLSIRRWPVWLGCGVFVAAIAVLWALEWLEGLWIWLTALVVTFLSVRACGIRWISGQCMAENATKDAVLAARTQRMRATVQSPATIALFAVCGLFLLLTCSGRLATCRLALAGYVKYSGGLGVGVDLQNAPAGELPLRKIRRFYGLGWLSLRGTGITDHDLRHLRNLTNLTSLDLSSTEITDDGLRSLRRLTKLRQLHVEDTDVTFAGVCQLIRLVGSLDEVCWKRGPSPEAYWKADSWMEAVVHLDGAPQIIYPQANSVRDRYLSLSGDCSNEDVRLVGTLPVRQLCFCRGRLTEDACRALPSLSNVESVTLWQVEGADIATKHVAEMPSLTGLVCVGEAIHDEVFPELDKLTQLETFQIGSTVTVPDLSPLRKLDSLKTLTLYDAPVSDISPLAELTTIESIVLQQTAVTDLSPLTSLPKLRVLFLYSTPVSDLTPLAKMPELRQLILHGTRTPAQEIAKLRKVLPKCEISAF